MSGRCGGLHCPGCNGGGGAAALVVLALVVIAAAIARPVVHAAVDVLEVAAIVVTAAAVLAVLAGVAYVALRVRRSRAIGTTAVSFPAPVVRRSSRALSAPRRRAIEAPPPSLADLQDLAARHGYDLTRRED